VMYMKFITDNLDYVFFNNTILGYITALGIFVGATIAFWVLTVVILRYLEKLSRKTVTDIDDTLIEIVRSFRPPFYWFLSFFVAVRFLSFPEIVDSIVTAILLFWIVYQVSITAGIFVKFVIRKYVYEDEDEEQKAKGATQLLSILVRIVVWSFGLLWILSNLGVDITSLIAGLGVGGIAIAFALQNILSDLFSSFAIYFDKPFQIGDFIVVGDKSGVVEKIGIKTTRVRSLQGEEIVFSNQELTSVQIQNFKKLKERRVVTRIGVAYETPNDLMKKIPEWIKDIVEGIERVRFDRVHFTTFGDSALMFELVYIVLSDQYEDYVDVQQEINLGIKGKFEEKNVDIAYPTQTLYIKK